MKSLNNTTKFDDKLFYQTITASLQKLLILPTEKEKQHKIETLEHSVRISHEKTFPVKATAPGEITISENRICIKHDNNINTLYNHILPAESLINGQPVQQGDLIGYAVEYCDIKIEITPTFFIQEQ